MLRLSSKETYARKRAEFQVITAVFDLGIPCSCPVDFGLCSGGEQVYTLLTWLEGRELGDVLASLPGKEQFRLGITAGELLRKVHTVPAPEEIQPWGERYQSKIVGYLAKYKACGLRFPQDQAVIQYILDHQHLLDGREQCLNHGDYHVGNMVYSSTGEIGIIDFNRWDYGDPWEEFNRIIWSARLSKPFAQGSIHGYFPQGPPREFFQLMALYIGVNMCASLSWAIPFGQREVQVALENSLEILDYYQGFENPIPTWYSK